MNRQAYRQLLLTTPGLGEYISGAILFEETLYQSTTDGKKFVDVLREEKIVPGIKVDKVCCFFVIVTNHYLLTDWLNLITCLVVMFFSRVLFRVWFRYRVQTMNLGAKGWMVWLLGLPNTTSKVLDLPSGKSFFVSSLQNFVVDIDIGIGCIEIELKWWFAFAIYRRTVVSIPCGPSALAVKEAAWGLARYAAISQVFFCLLMFVCNICIFSCSHTAIAFFGLAATLCYLGLKTLVWSSE